MANWHLNNTLLSLGIAVGSSLVLLSLRRIFLGALSRWVERTFPSVGKLVVSVFRSPSIYLCIAGGLYLGVAISELSQRYSQGLYQATHSVVILSLTLAAANFAGALFKNFMARAHGERQTSGLLVGLIEGAVMAVGILAILSVLGISVAPLLTALGVGGLAVALALKDTLENLFAGIYLLSDRAIKVGDYVKLESGAEGYVEDIGWRTTRIRVPEVNLLILPNSKFAQSSVTNFCLPDRKVQVRLDVAVSFDANPQQVEDELIALVQRGSEDIVGLLAKPTPVVRTPAGFNLDAMDFILYFHVKEFSDQSFVRHELKKRLFLRFKEGVFPFRKSGFRCELTENRWIFCPDNTLLC